MNVLLELLRIIIILGILGGLGWAVLGEIYSIYVPAEPFSWIGIIGLLLLIFVVYRNKLQFSGWYKGTGRIRLSHRITKTLLISSVILFVLPFALGYYLR